MIGMEDSPYTYEYKKYFKILPAINNWDKTSERIKDGKLVSEGFVYTSDTNTDWMSIEELRDWVTLNADKMGLI